MADDVAPFCWRFGRLQWWWEAAELDFSLRSALAIVNFGHGTRRDWWHHSGPAVPRPPHKIERVSRRMMCKGAPARGYVWMERMVKPRHLMVWLAE